MSSTQKIVAQMRNSVANVAYSDLYKVCEAYFGPPRQEATSHAYFSTPWEKDPIVNIQPGKDGKAKPYQVRQVLKAITLMKNYE